MAVNERPISLREGKVFLDGIEVMDAVKCTIIATPEVWTGAASLGSRANSTRWLGVSYRVTITQRRSTPWLKKALQEYMASGKTPEFTVQGLSNDENSDYFEKNGSDTVTATGCVLTGDIPLMTLDKEGTIAQDNLTFNAYMVA